MRGYFHRLAWILLASATLIGVVPHGLAQAKRALLIAIDTYDLGDQPISHPDLARKGDMGEATRWDGPVWHNLDGAVNDANSMHALLTSSKFGFPEKNIRLVTQEKATRNGILAAMREELVTKPNRGDVVVFYYAGHGSQRRNSKKPPSYRDQTIVPYDANQLVFDVRDKEIRQIFNDAIKKGVLLTAIFDSCHSGAVARGIPVGRPAQARYIPYDPRDSADPPDMDASGNPVPAPEDTLGGAIVLSAAQSSQLASEWTSAGVAHGAFTVALMESLRALPANSPAPDVYKRVKVLMEGMGLSDQQPVFNAPKDRRQMSLFGKNAGSEKLTVAVRPGGVADDGTVELDGGYGVGLGVGSDLTKKPGDSDNAKSTAAAVRIRITELEGFTRSKAELIAPATANQVEPGDLFELDKWVAPEQSRLKVWLPPATLTAKAIEAVAKELAKLQSSERIEWVADPVMTSPSYLISWDGTNWDLAKGSGTPQSLGPNPTAAEVQTRLAAAGPKPSFFLDLPPAKELAAGLGFTDEAASVEVVSSPQTAQYLLVGRISNNHIEYTWMQKNVSADPEHPFSQAKSGTLCSSNSSYPPRTDWIPGSNPMTEVPSLGKNTASDRLTEYAYKLARVRAWLELPAPPAGETDAFPYRLVLRKLPAGSPPQDTQDGPVADGERYGLVLKAVSDVPATLKPQWVYVAAIDCSGTGQLLYPFSGQGNFLPQQKEGKSGWPREIVLTGAAEHIKIGSPFGIDTYIMLTTLDQLPDTSAFNFSGVLTRGADSKNPLAHLLSDAGMNTRGPKVEVPANWSVSYTPVLSVPGPTN
jgi:hypothetical protein